MFHNIFSLSWNSSKALQSQDFAGICNSEMSFQKCLCFCITEPIITEPIIKTRAILKGSCELMHSVPLLGSYGRKPKYDPRLILQRKCRNNKNNRFEYNLGLEIKVLLSQRSLHFPVSNRKKKVAFYFHAFLITFPLPKFHLPFLSVFCLRSAGPTQWLDSSKGAAAIPPSGKNVL